jgi:hypothetical protein
MLRLASTPILPTTPPREPASKTEEPERRQQHKIQSHADALCKPEIGACTAQMMSRSPKANFHFQVLAAARSCRADGETL